MLAALQKAGVPSALHAYPAGWSRFWLLRRIVTVVPAGWLDKVWDWLKEQGF